MVSGLQQYFKYEMSLACGLPKVCLPLPLSPVPSPSPSLFFFLALSPLLSPPSPSLPLSLSPSLFFLLTLLTRWHWRAQWRIGKKYKKKPRNYPILMIPTSPDGPKSLLWFLSNSCSLFPVLHLSFFPSFLFPSFLMLNFYYRTNWKGILEPDSALYGRREWATIFGGVWRSYLFLLLLYFILRSIREFLFFPSPPSFYFCTLTIIVPAGGFLLLLGLTKKGVIFLIRQQRLNLRLCSDE